MNSFAPSLVSRAVAGISLLLNPASAARFCTIATCNHSGDYFEFLELKNNSNLIKSEYMEPDARLPHSNFLRSIAGESCRLEPAMQLATRSAEVFDALMTAKILCEALCAGGPSIIQFLKHVRIF